MIYTVPAGKKSITIYDGSASCGTHGVIIQSLDALGQIFVGTEQGLLDTKADANGVPQAGLLVQRSSGVTNIPSTIVMAPCSEILSARNTGGADSLLSVEVFKL